MRRKAACSLLGLHLLQMQARKNLRSGSTALGTEGAQPCTSTLRLTHGLPPCIPRPCTQVTASELHIGADATLVIEAPNAQIRSLDLQRGALLIKAAAGSQEAAAAGSDGVGGEAAGAAATAAPVVVDGLTVDNAGWEWQPLDPDAGAAEEEYIRGFRVVRHEQQVLP